MTGPQLFAVGGDDMPVDAIAAYAYPATDGGRTHWLRANMIASADGAAMIDGRAGGLGNRTDQQLLGLLRGLADVVVAGAGTVTAEGYGPARVRPEYQELRAAAGQPPAAVMAVVSGRLQLDFSAPLFTAEDRRPIVVTCAGAPADRRLAAEQVADVIEAGTDAVDAALMVQALAARGHSRLLCEGGPTLLGCIAAAGVLDELCLTISPLLVGGPSRRVLDGVPVVPPARLRLTQLLRDADDLLYARYEVAR